MSVALVTTEY